MSVVIICNKCKGTDLKTEESDYKVDIPLTMDDWAAGKPHLRTWDITITCNLCGYKVVREFGRKEA